jgi:hypothetical protein
MCKVNLITRHRKKERRRRKKHYRVIFDGDRRWLEIVMKSLSRKHLGEKGQKEEAVFSRAAQIKWTQVGSKLCEKELTS